MQQDKGTKHLRESGTINAKHKMRMWELIAVTKSNHEIENYYKENSLNADLFLCYILNMF